MASSGASKEEWESLRGFDEMEYQQKPHSQQASRDPQPHAQRHAKPHAQRGDTLARQAVAGRGQQALEAPKRPRPLASGRSAPGHSRLRGHPRRQLAPLDAGGQKGRSKPCGGGCLSPILDKRVGECLSPGR